ncbi:energy transducer TonB [Mucilaginibacter sp.]|jgi:beta-lactamase regulating signal transducer with metallopeptidase domain|uniref:energy transducer TonB n=1 Tax=Mucilaginibacter sp. TaxID=1882438 RepID=UPI002C7DD45F|nr:energy transducer TonB [Mucilaginibacter sp.]HTI57578.1 energy transducer TonB [Mucilaginibacter sp.]
MSWWQYLLLVNLYLVLFYGFYVLLLRRETFFNLNRAYLVTSALLSFFIPLIHYEWISKLFITQKVQHTISVYAKPIAVYGFKPIEQHDLTIGHLLLYIYTAGAIILTLRLVSQLASLKRLINHPESNSAFSFFKLISLGNNLENNEVIAEHEKAHASQWHSADIMLVETIAIINWFNPIVYFYRLGIKHIHEYIADRQALRNGTSKSEYALLLLSQTLKTPAHQLVNPFYNHSLLRKRIEMLQKSRSKYMALLKYGLSAPLFMLMLILSSAAVIKNHTVRLFNTKAEEVMMSPAAQSIELKTPGLAENTVMKTVAAPEVTAKHMSYLKASGIEDIKSDPVFVTFENQPHFKGGMTEFYKFLAGNLRYPNWMMRNNIQGKVFITMTVEKDGSLSDIKSVRDIGFGSAEEAIRVLKLSPKWVPGYQNGQPVRVRYTLPISFNLVKEKNSFDTVSKVTYNLSTNDDDAAPQSASTTEAGPDTARKYNLIIADNFDFQSPNVLFVLDGKAIPGMTNLNPNDIQSVKVIRHPAKDNVYYVLYGAKALNGVVVIESKQAWLKQQAANN